MRFPIAILLLLLLTVAQILRGQQRSDYAVFFPVTQYPKGSGWNALEKTLPECQAIAGILNREYGFRTEVLAEKNKQQIKDKLTELATRTYGPQDQLLLFFSMHGNFDEAGMAGCLVPAGSKGDDPGFDTWLLHTELQTLVTRIPCPHILLTIDACYSGTFGGDKAKPGPPAGDDCDARIRSALSRKTRLYLTAGGKVKVPADSDFARRWQNALTGTGADDGLLTYAELNLGLADASPAPRWGSFAGDGGGSFVFVRRGGCGAPPPVADPDQAACQSARRQNSLDAWEYYLATYPNGRCRAEALEERAWLQAERLGSRAAWQVYLDTYPNGRHAEAARGKTGPPPGPPDDMMLIKGGTFQMGSDDGESDEKPLHSVTLNDFYLCNHEVTVAEFRAFAEDTGHQTDAEKVGSAWGYNGTNWEEVTGRNWRHDPQGNAAGDNYPVIYVSWNDAVEFCKWKSRKTGQNYRLPTEAEWEYAAGNGSSHTKYSWGNGEPSGKKGGSVADETGAAKFNWTKTATNIFMGYTDGYATTAPVRSFDANMLGLHDMSGNVYEWCSDWYGDYSSGSQTNPQGPASGSVRVCRGGSWNDDPEGCRVADRSGNAPGDRGSNLGFRLARTK